MPGPIMPRTLRFFLVCFLAGALAVPLSGARAEEISSVYTPLELARCKDVTPEEVKDDGGGD
jgi:hypothetical protein